MRKPQRNYTQEFIRRLVKQNRIHLTQWLVKEVEEDGSIHFIGFSSSARLFVVSSCIIHFNKSIKLGTTRNEDQYFLGGPPGSPGAESMWETWCKNRNIPVGLDITKEYI